MKLPLFRTLVIAAALVATPAQAKTRLIVLPPDAAANGAVLLNYIAETVIVLAPTDQLLVYAARPVSQIAAIARPSDPNMNNARIKAALAAQFKPVKDYLAALPPGAAAEPPGGVVRRLDEGGPRRRARRQRTRAPAPLDERAPVRLVVRLPA